VRNVARLFAPIPYCLRRRDNFRGESIVDNGLQHETDERTKHNGKAGQAPQYTERLCFCAA
jgi:hypothetical protein